MQPDKIEEEYKVTLPGIGTLTFRVWTCSDISGKWQGTINIPLHMPANESVMPVYESNSKPGMLQKAKEDLSKRYPGATFEWDTL